MKKFLLIFMFFNAYIIISAQTHLSGNLSNYEDRKVKIRIGSDGFTKGLNIKTKLRTDEKGYFELTIDNLYSKGTFNYLLVGRRRVFFYLEPNDSLEINIDKRNPTEVEFINKYPNRSHFCNDYQNQRAHRMKEARLTYPNDTFQRLEKEYALELILLEDYNTYHGLDTDFYNYFKADLYYSFINTIGIRLPNSNYYNELLNQFHSDEIVLKHNLIYYSSMTGYLKKISNQNIELQTVDALISAFALADKFLKYPFNIGYKAYLICYQYLSFHNDKLLSSESFINLRDDFIKNCPDTIIKLELKELIETYEENN